MKKVLVLILALVLTLPVFSTALAEDTVEITVFCAYASEDPHGPYVYEYAEKFMAANPGIKVEVSAVSSNDIYTKVAAMANTDDLPTLVYTSADQAASLYDLGLVEDLKNYLSEETLASFGPGVVDACTINGEMAYYPIDLQPLAVLYRTDRFEEAGLEVPTTWDEFLACAQALTREVDGEEQWGFSMVGTNNSSGQSRFMSYLWSHGFELVKEENGEWVTDMDSEEFLKAFTFWTDMNNVHHVVPTGITEVAYDTAANYFAMEYTSIMMTGSNALGVAYNVNPGLEGKIGSFAIPGDYPGSMMNTEGYMLSSKATEEQKQAAVDFMNYFVTGDPDMSFWKLSGKLPSNEGGLASDYLQGADYAGYLGTLEKGTRDIMTFPGTAALKGLIGDAYSAVFSGEKTNEEAVATMLSELDELMADYN